MGRKGVSKRKPKKSNPFSNGNNGNPANTLSRENLPVQSLVNNNEAAPNRGGSNPARSNKKNRKGK